MPWDLLIYVALINWIDVDEITYSVLKFVELKKAKWKGQKYPALP